MTEEQFFLRSVAHFIGLRDNLNALEFRDVFKKRVDSKGKIIRNDFLEYMHKIQIYISIEYTTLMNRLKKSEFEDVFVEHAEKLAKVNDILSDLDNDDLTRMLYIMMAEKESEIAVVDEHKEEHFKMFLNLYESSFDKNRFMTLMAGINA